MGTTDSWVRNRSKSCKNCCKMLHVRFSPLLGGGLEPLFRVLFSAIFHGVSPGISIRVENYGIERKENCSQSVVILRTELICVGAILCLFTGMWRIPAHAAFRSSYLRRHPLSQGTSFGSAHVQKLGRSFAAKTAIRQPPTLACANFSEIQLANRNAA